MSGRTVALWLPVAAYMALIFHVQGLEAPPSPRGVNDKILHLGGYALLGVLGARATAGGLGRSVSLAAALTAVAIAAAYGVTDEVHQGLVPMRTRDILDWYADTAGAVAGVGLVMGWGILGTSRTR